MMGFWVYIFLGGFLAAMYFLFPPLFWLAVLFVVLYGIYRMYRWIERLLTPHGRRIKHGLLRGHLQSEYGSREGNKIYKEMVGELRKKGYR